MVKFFVNLKSHKFFRYSCYAAVFIYFFLLFLTFSARLISPVNNVPFHLKGVNDFVSFYTGGKLINRNAGELYDLKLQYMIQEKIISDYNSIFLPFLNPPFVARLFSPLSKISVQTANNIWILINLSLFGVFCWIIFLQFSKLGWWTRMGIILGILTFSPLIFNLSIGQLSLVITVCITFSWILHKRGQELYSGIFLSFLCIKPQYVVLPLLAIIVQRRPKLLLGFLLGAVIFFTLSFFPTGVKGLVSYLHFLNVVFNWTNAYGTDIYHQFNLQTAILLISKLPMHHVRFIWAVIVTIITLLTLYAWGIKDTKVSYISNIRWALLILAIVLISPHTNFQDLVFLTGAIFILIPKTESEAKKIPKILWLPLLLFFPFFFLFSGFHPLNITVIVLYLIIFFFLLFYALLSLNKPVSRVNGRSLRKRKHALINS